MSEILYPLKFVPILKPKIWGGNKFKSLSLTNFEDSCTFIGEKWQISDLKENLSFVVEGPLKKKSLRDLLQVYKEKLVGKKVYEKFGNKFPLLIKLIDANQDLSIQVHPGDKIAQKQHNCFGKSEMWYILEAQKESNLILGFKESIDKKNFENLANSGQIKQYLKEVSAKKGDFFYIPSGSVHAIGKGIFLLEVQQSSDITYRIYDYNRKDKKGKKRDLHISEAKKVIDFSNKKNYQVNYKIFENKFSLVLKTLHFSIQILSLNQKVTLNYLNKDSFVILFTLNGELNYFFKETLGLLEKNECLFLAASIDEITLMPLKSESVKIFEISL